MCIHGKFQSGVFSSKIIGKLCGRNLLSGEISNGFKFRHMNVELFREHKRMSAPDHLSEMHLYIVVCHLQDKS